MATENNNKKTTAILINAHQHRQGGETHEWDNDQETLVIRPDDDNNNNFENRPEVEKENSNYSEHVKAGAHKTKWMSGHTHTLYIEELSDCVNLPAQPLPNTKQFFRLLNLFFSRPL